MQEPAPQQVSLPPTTTHQEDVTTAGQRRINLVWEYTQACIALTVVAANMVVAVYQGLGVGPGTHPPTLSNTLFLVVGFYFSRTNHQAIGGVGQKPDQQQKYVGR
jgi:hypothetical protein